MSEPTPEISVEQLGDDQLILDVREDDEWQAGHIATATHIPAAEVPQRLGEVPEADPVYVICRGGGRSARVTAWLNENGLNAVNVADGMTGWQKAGKPMTSKNGQPPTVI